MRPLVYTEVTVFACAFSLLLLATQVAQAEDFNAEAVELEKKGDWAGDELLAERWTKLESGNGFAWMTLGIAEDHLGKKVAAISAYEKALPLQPPNSGYARQMSLGALEADYKATGQNQKLRQLYATLRQQSPSDAQMMMMQYSDALRAGSAPPSLPDVVPIARAALGDAKKWQSDAALVSLEVKNESDSSYSVATGRPYEIDLTFLSEKTRQLLLVTFTSGYSDIVTPVSGDSFTTAIPIPFVDLPDALKTARASGMATPLDHADLAVWHEQGKAMVSAWLIAPQHDPRLRVFVVDASSGKPLPITAISGPMPGNDAALAAARRRLRDAIAPAPQAAVAPRAVSSARGGAARCVPCLVHYQQAQSYITNHPAASFGQAYAATAR